MTSHGSMQWCGTAWAGRAYTGPLQELGQGIPRKFKLGGLKEFAYHLAFGYTSGFPLRDIIYWSTMVTFFPRATQKRVDRNMP